MQLLIIGANRGIGLELVQQSLERGYQVTALVRRAGTSHADDRLKVVQGDILDRASIDHAMPEQDAVLSAIGTKPGRSRISVFSEGIRNVIDSMESHGIRRLVSVSGIGAGDSRGHGGFIYARIFLPLLLKQIYEDKDRHEEIIKRSGLEWIIARPGFLTNGPFTGGYRVLTDLAGVRARKISRADVAHFILEQVQRPTHLYQTPLLTY